MAITPFTVIQRCRYLVPIESSYKTSYCLIILTYILYCTISKLLRIIGQIFAFHRGESTSRSLTHLFGANPITQYCEI